MALSKTGKTFITPLANFNPVLKQHHHLQQHRTFTSIVHSTSRQCLCAKYLVPRQDVHTRRLVMTSKTASSTVSRFKTDWMNINSLSLSRFVKSRRCVSLLAPQSKNFSSLSSLLAPQLNISNSVSSAICSSSTLSCQYHSNLGISASNMNTIQNYHLHGHLIHHKLKLPSSSAIFRRFKNTRKDLDSDDEARFKELPMLFKHKTKLRKAPSRGSKERGLADFAEMKRRIKKKPAGVVAKKDMLICSAYATADSYNLVKLKKTLMDSEKYSPVDLPQDADDVLYMHLVNNATKDEHTEIVFFEEGTVIFWNAPPSVENEVLWILEYHQHSPYDETSVREENEQINYRHKEIDTYVTNKGVITLDTRDPQKLPLEKFAISNAISHSVKLAMWENSLENFADSIEYIPDYMSLGKPIHMSREEVMKKRGKLFALRHRINLSSDLLIASDFYWDRDHLETLYQKMCSFYSIARRTRVMNERLSHCSELVELMRLHLSEKHSTRLEWMIIILIAVEVLFEVIHYIKTYLASEEPLDTASQVSYTPVYNTGSEPDNHPDTAGIR